MNYLIIGLNFLIFFVQAQTISWHELPTFNQVAEFLPEPITPDIITYDTDVACDQREFENLTGLYAQQEITAYKLHTALKHLFYKNKFRDITFNYDADAHSLHCVMQGGWTFERLKVSGIWVGRDWYNQHYLMEPGDLFDEDKHHHSMQKIREASRRLGFFNVTTKSELSYKHLTKSVTVHAHVHHGTRFSIDALRLELTADKLVPSDDRKNMDRLIYKKFLRPLRKKKYAKDMLQQCAHDIKKMCAHHGFLNVSLELDETINKDKQTVDLVWRINIHQKRTFIFFGNNFFSTIQLLDLMLQFGKSSWMLPASLLAEELLVAYHKKGFWDVVIDTREEGERSFFVIKEGTRATITHVELRGVQSFSERTLIKRCFGTLKRRSYFDQKLLEKSLDSLIGYYVRNGFLQCRLINHEYIPLEKPGAYTLVVTLDEGALTTINAVTVPDDPSYEKQGPFARFNKKKKAIPFNSSAVQEQKKWLLDHLQNKGYLYAQVKPELITNEDETITLCWHLYPGQKVQFGKTIIHGSSSVPYEYIMRELAYKEGQLWDQDALRQSFMRLKNLNIFDSVSFTPLSSSGTDRPILIKVHEDDPFELRLRGGLEFQHIEQYQTFGGVTYKVGGTLLMKNPTNHADQLEFLANAARSHREIMLKYWYPWVFGLPLNGLAQAYSIKYDQPGFIGDNKNIYTIFQNGFLFGLRRKNAWLDFGLNLGFEISRTSISSDDAKTQECAQMLACAINFDPRLLNKRIPYIFAEPTLLLDFLDNNLNPHKGTFWLLSLKGMFPTNETFQDSFFVKFLFEHSSFITAADVVTFAFRFRVGHIFHRDFCDIPPNERFYLGGAHSVRSYQADHAPPLGCFIDCEGKKNTVPRGGKTMVNVNAEARIATLPNIHLALFQDMGLLSGDDFCDFDMNHVVAGTGFGVRYQTPVGPLRFDIAWKWKKHTVDEPRMNWFLTFGHAF